MGKKISIRSFIQILTRYLEGTSSDQERSKLLSWLEKRARLSDFSVSNKRKQDLEVSLWQDIQDKIKQKDDRSLHRRTINRAVWRVAAAVSILAMLAGLWLFNRTDPSDTMSTGTHVEEFYREIFNNHDGSKEIILSDGSRIVLQPGSSLSYFSMDARTRRIVQLKGKAFFDVAVDPARPFVVHSGDVVTTVLGTSFFIESPGGNKPTVVTVKTGLVMVAKAIGEENQKGEDIMLRPNETAIFETTGGPVVLKGAQQIPVWGTPNAHSVKIYDGVSLSEILLDIETQFNVNIDFNKEKLVGCKISTEFSMEGVEERLEILAKTINGLWIQNDDRFRFEGEGCK